jgi:hypothetical protein
VFFGSNNIPAIKYYLGDTALDSTSQYWTIGNGGIQYYDPWHSLATKVTKAELSEMMVKEGGITIGIYRSNSRQLFVVNGRVLHDGTGTGGVTATGLNVCEAYGGSGTESKVAIIQGAAWHSSSGIGYFDGDFLLDVTKGPERLWAPRNVWLPLPSAGGGSYEITPVAASIAVTGSALTLNVTRVVTPVAASVAVTGGTLTLTYATAGAYDITPVAASVAVTGAALTLEADRTITPVAATIAVTGQSLT